MVIKNPAWCIVMKSYNYQGFFHKIEMEREVYMYLKTLRRIVLYGQVPERSKGVDLRSTAVCFVGSNPTLFTRRQEERAAVSCGTPSLSIRTNKCGQTQAPIVQWSSLRSYEPTTPVQSWVGASGQVPERSKGVDLRSTAICFAGSNPALFIRCGGTVYYWSGLVPQ